MKRLVVALIAGAIFACGLVLGGMTLPGKVVAFLDITGDWDPSLMFVMAGAMLVYFPVYRWVRGMQRPLFANRFRLPTRKDIDVKLLGGAVLFGIGWGIGGFCPGPALTSLGSLADAALWFVPAMFVGFGLVALAERKAQ